MPNVCTICADPRRRTIDAAMAGRGDRSIKQVANDFGLTGSYESVKRHVRSHAGVDAPTIPTELVPGRRQERESRQAEAERRRNPADAVETFRLAFDMDPKPWQEGYLRETRNIGFLKGRQIGATQCAAARAIHVARAESDRLVCVVSPSLRQSTEITVRSRSGLRNLGETLAQDQASLLRLENGSRILSLPGNSRGIRGYAVDELILDEAAWIDDDTFFAARAMTAATRGRIVAQSTPGAPWGFFHDLVCNPCPHRKEGEKPVVTPIDGRMANWHRMEVISADGGIDPDFLAEELEALRENLAKYRQEYECMFADPELSGTPLFDPFDVARAFAEKAGMPPGPEGAGGLLSRLGIEGLGQ